MATSFCFPAGAADSPTHEPESPITRETVSVRLLTSMRARGPTSSSPAAVGQKSQGQLVSEHWFSTINLSEEPTVFTHITGNRFTSVSYNVLILLTSVLLPPSYLSVFVLLLNEIFLLNQSSKNIYIRFSCTRAP